MLRVADVISPAMNKMTQIRAGKVPARVAPAAFDPAGPSSSAYRAFLMLTMPARREQLPVACVARRQHAVEHVDAAGDALDQVDRRAVAHQVARPIGRQQRAVCSTMSYMMSTGSPTLRPPMA